MVGTLTALLKSQGVSQVTDKLVSCILGSVSLVERGTHKLLLNLPYDHLENFLVIHPVRGKRLCLDGAWFSSCIDLRLAILTLLKIWFQRFLLQCPPLRTVAPS